MNNGVIRVSDELKRKLFTRVYAKNELRFIDYIKSTPSILFIYWFSAYTFLNFDGIFSFDEVKKSWTSKRNFEIQSVLVSRKEYLKDRDE